MKLEVRKMSAMTKGDKINALFFYDRAVNALGSTFKGCPQFHVDSVQRGVIGIEREHRPHPDKKTPE